MVTLIGVQAWMIIAIPPLVGMEFISVLMKFNILTNKFRAKKNNRV